MKDLEKSTCVDVLSVSSADDDYSLECKQDRRRNEKKNTRRDSFYQVVRNLLDFDPKFDHKFMTSDTRYQFGCNDTNCKYTCKVPHLTLIVRARGLPDDKIGIILHIDGKYIENMLPPVPVRRYSYKRWENSRFQLIRRMLICLYYEYGNDPPKTKIQKIIRVVSKPIHVYGFGCVMGRVLDLQKRLYSLIEWRFD
jgi:hypothetical protein